jgi:hypothetical protein
MGQLESLRELGMQSQKFKKKIKKKNKKYAIVVHSNGNFSES